ncbi:hypothetical protein ARMGADRAFT_1064240 [Armillaria gallica]|uniref:Uncharacterized protein n=1 Tax=Armillaria gallica TaxID=47427 RepID=A0A2H3D7Q3_ARMGA|nr:hypothetical protein ARMGADRAFT_1064240 [Armillaria gallica]
MREIRARASRAVTDIFSSESTQMKTYLQIGGQTTGSVPIFLNTLFLPWESSAVHEFIQGRASDTKEECKEKDQDIESSRTNRSRARDEPSRGTDSMRNHSSINALAWWIWEFRHYQCYFRRHCSTFESTLLSVEPATQTILQPPQLGVYGFAAHRHDTWAAGMTLPEGRGEDIASRHGRMRAERRRWAEGPKVVHALPTTKPILSRTSKTEARTIKPPYESTSTHSFQCRLDTSVSPPFRRI